MKSIPYRDIDLQIRRAETGFGTRALPSLAREACGAAGSPLTGLEGKSCRGLIALSLG
jgi:hypothetical protein